MVLAAVLLVGCHGVAPPPPCPGQASDSVQPVADTVGPDGPAHRPSAPPTGSRLGGAGGRGSAPHAARDGALDPNPRPLLATHTVLGEQVAHLRLAKMPSPLESGEALGARIGVPNLYLKRDDRLGSPWGGSKVRKLEFLLAAAANGGATTVLTFGGVGSNHALATALYARRAGLDAQLFLVPEPITADVDYHLRAMAGLGATLHHAPTMQAARQRAAAIRSGLARPESGYIIAPGGSDAVGNLGFVNGAFELADQVRAGVMPVPDRIFLAAGTLGSAAGLAVGLTLCDLPSRIVAVRAAPTATRSRLEEQIVRTAELLRTADPTIVLPAWVASRVTLDGSQLGRGYARPTAEGRKAAEIAREAAGLELDGTYTAKALAALIEQGPAEPDEVVLFWLSYDPRRLPVDEVAAADLPPALRGYLQR